MIAHARKRKIPGVSHKSNPFQRGSRIYREGAKSAKESICLGIKPERFFVLLATFAARRFKLIGSGLSKSGNAAVILLILASLYPSGHVGAQTAQEAVAAVEDHYGGVNELSAKVVQKNLLKAIGRTQTFEGALSIKKPGRLRLDYTNGQIILVDGKTALFYSKKSAQLVKKTFADVQQMNVPLAFLLGAAHIRDDFDVLQPDPSSPRSLELLPKSPGASMKKLLLRTDDTGRITGLTIHDKSGNTSEITFSDVREGVPIDDKLFVFKPPAGTEIIEQ